MLDTFSSHLLILVKTFHLPTLMTDGDKKKICDMCHLPTPTAQSKRQMCRECRECSVGVTFLAFFGNFAKKMHTALSISHVLLRMNCSIMYLKDLKVPEDFLAFFNQIPQIAYSHFTFYLFSQ
jgi:hypothetical protein